MNFQLQTLSFPKLLINNGNDDSYEDVFYGAGNLFTNVPVQKMTDYVLRRIYV